MKPHKHAELIKLWADGYPIQIRIDSDAEWKDIEKTSWRDLFEYRIKPKFEIGDSFYYARQLMTVKSLQWDSESKQYQVFTNHNTFVFENNIKKEKEPKLVPFTFDDAEMLIGKAIKCNDGLLLVCLIEAIEKDGVTIGDTEYTFDRLLEEWVFLDGTPCGKEVA